MAVVSISRIQLRRGRELTGTGVPQLASGELGWAIDTQKLYIGSGAVTEGAPAVENIELLTERSNILDLADQYVYGENVQTGPNPSTPVSRSIKQKLDDTVSLNDFEHPNDESADITIQRAIDELFLDSSRSNVTLRIPAKEYTIQNTIHIPESANIVGDGAGKTVLINNGSAAQIFRTKGAENDSFIDDSAINDESLQPKNILIQGMTLKQSSFYEILRLQNCRDSVFRDISFEGSWNDSAGETDQGGIIIDAGSNSAASCDNNRFVNCNFSNLSYLCQSLDNSDSNHFENSHVNTLLKGFVFGSAGNSTGPNRNIIENYMFTNVHKSAIVFESGSYNISSSNHFVKVGTSNSSDQSYNYTDPIIVFGNDTNISRDDYFGRTQFAMTSESLSFTYEPEIQGPKSYINSFPVTTAIGSRLSPEKILNVPTDQDTGTVEIEYIYRIGSNDIYRNGTITLVFNKSEETASLTDNYSHSGTGDPENLIFSLDLNDFNSGSSYLPVLAENTLVDAILNENDELKFTIKHVA